MSYTRHSVLARDFGFNLGEIVRWMLVVDSWFQTSVECLQNVRRQCQASDVVDDVVDKLLRPHLSLFQLCTRRNLYEGRSVGRSPVCRHTPHTMYETRRFLTVNQNQSCRCS